MDFSFSVSDINNTIIAQFSSNSTISSEIMAKTRGRLEKGFEGIRLNLLETRTLLTIPSSRCTYSYISIDIYRYR